MQAFDEMDEDGDGELTAEEIFELLPGERPESVFLTTWYDGLFPPADDAFFFRKRRPQRRGARQTRDAFRDRASQVCRAVPPEHVGWFARVFTDILTAAAAAEDVSDEADDAFWAGSTATEPVKLTNPKARSEINADVVS